MMYLAFAGGRTGTGEDGDRRAEEAKQSKERTHQASNSGYALLKQWRIANG